MSNEPSSSGANSNSSSTGSQKSAEDLIKEIEALKSNRDDVLTEKRKLADRVREFEKEKKDLEEQKLKEKEDYKSILTLRETELENLKKSISEMQTKEELSKKLNSFLEVLDGKVDPKYWGMINLEEINLNPDTKNVDQMSVAKAVENFKKTYPELIKTGTGPTTPPNAPQSGELLTYEKWTTLPLKEQKARYQEMLKNDKKI